MVTVTAAADSSGGGGDNDDEQRCNTKVDEVHSNQTTETVLLNGDEAKKNRSGREASDENVAEVV